MALKIQVTTAHGVTCSAAYMKVGTVILSERTKDDGTKIGTISLEVEVWKDEAARTAGKSKLDRAEFDRFVFDYDQNANIGAVSAKGFIYALVKAVPAIAALNPVDC